MPADKKQTASKRAAAKSTDADEPAIVEEYVDFPVALARLVRESVHARLRHRALIEVLEEGPFLWETYASRLKTLLERDEAALLNQAVLEESSFLEKFAQWKKDDRTRYGFERKKPKK